MALLHEVDLRDADDPVDIRARINKEFWKWYEDSKDEVAIEVRILFVLRFEVKIRDLFTVFVQLFGAPRTNYAA
jgi:hypothetical protein